MFIKGLYLFYFPFIYIQLLSSADQSDLHRNLILFNTSSVKLIELKENGYLKSPKVLPCQKVDMNLVVLQLKSNFNWSPRHYTELETVFPSYVSVGRDNWKYKNWSTYHARSQGEIQIILHLPEIADWSTNTYTHEFMKKCVGGVILTDWDLFNK